MPSAAEAAPIRGYLWHGRALTKNTSWDADAEAEAHCLLAFMSEPLETRGELKLRHPAPLFARWVLVNRFRRGPLYRNRLLR